MCEQRQIAGINMERLTQLENLEKRLHTIANFVPFTIEVSYRAGGHRRLRHVTINEEDIHLTQAALSKRHKLAVAVISKRWNMYCAQHYGEYRRWPGPGRAPTKIFIENFQPAVEQQPQIVRSRAHACTMVEIGARFLGFPEVFEMETLDE